jgi:hypothetical protein
MTLFCPLAPPAAARFHFLGKERIGTAGNLPEKLTT